jgi:hypothetical protein
MSVVIPVYKVLSSSLHSTMYTNQTGDILLDMKNTDHTGKRINTFTVIKRLKKKFNNKNTMYLCLCDCGTKFETHTGYIMQKYGCDECSKQHHYDESWKSRRANTDLKPSRRTTLSQLSPESKNGIRGSYANYIVNWIKSTALKRKLVWDLDHVEVFYMIQKPCYYCGAEVHFPETRNGLDRMDNTEGYVEGNVVPCCYPCNIAKHEMSQEEFKNHITNIYNNWVMN